MFGIDLSIHNSHTAAVQQAASTTAIVSEGSAGGDVVLSSNKKLKESKDDGDQKPAPASSSSSSTIAPSSSSNLPEAVANHAIIQPIHYMDAGWRQIIMAEASKPYFGRLMSFVSQEVSSKQVREELLYLFASASVIHISNLIRHTHLSFPHTHRSYILPCL